MSMTIDAIELEVLWGSLISTVNEQARALQRAAFSPIVREAGDLANALFDREGRMVAQAVTGTPGHINSLARAASAILEEYPVDTLEPGRRADHQRPLQDGRPAARRHGPEPGVPQRAGDRPLRLDDPPHRRRWLRHRCGRRAMCSKRVCGSRSPSSSSPASATTTCGGSSSPTSASRSTWPVTSTPRSPPGRSGRSGCSCSAILRTSTTSRLWPTRSSSGQKKRRGAPSGRSRPARTGRTPCSTWPMAVRSTSTWPSPSTPTPARSSSTTRDRPVRAPPASTW